MNDRAAFLAEIRSRPDDDTPRLVYADWLQEHDQGDRAELIRVQCRIAAIDTEVQSGEDCKRCDLCEERRQLRKRAFTLLHHRRAISPPAGLRNNGGTSDRDFWRAQSGAPDRPLFVERGFIDELKISFSFLLAHASEIFDCPDGVIRGITLTSMPILNVLQSLGRARRPPSHRNCKGFTDLEYWLLRAFPGHCRYSKVEWFCCCGSLLDNDSLHDSQSCGPPYQEEIEVYHPIQWTLPDASRRQITNSFCIRCNGTGRIGNSEYGESQPCSRCDGKGIVPGVD